MKSQNCIDTIASPSPTSSFGLPPWVHHVLRGIGRWVDRSRQRRHLAQLSDAMLKDIGLTRMDVGIEIEKPFWRP